MINLADTIIRCKCGKDIFSKYLGNNNWIKCYTCGREYLNTTDAQLEYWDKIFSAHGLMEKT